MFWTRAALCIGTITILAIARQPPSPLPAAIPALPWQARLAAAGCRAQPDTCAAALTRGWQLLNAAPGLSRAMPANGSATPEPVANSRRFLK